MVVYDIEVAPNRAMVGFMDVNTREVWQYQHDEVKKIRNIIRKHELVGFNSKNYDDVILTQMLNRQSVECIYTVSCDLVEGDGKAWDYRPKVRSIDLMPITPKSASLKLYGAQLKAEKLKDLPYDPHQKHSKKMWKNVMKYNINDLELTLLLYEFNKKAIALRRDIGKQYKVNVLASSDAQIAEAIFKAEFAKKGIGVRKARNNMRSPTSVKYKAPRAVKFKSKELKGLVKQLEARNIQLDKGGSPMMPPWLKDKKIEIGGNVFNIGMGGLHSTEKSLSVKGKLGNIDVASMYPKLITTLGLFPPHLGKHFLDIYSTILERRLKAKRTGDNTTNTILKITLNGSYGKLGSRYSFLYAPELLLAITFTGQLYLLMLIEAMDRKGVKILSANTDGIEYVIEKGTKKIVKKLVKKWEDRTGLTMEFGYYNALHARDINNYIAIYDGYTKRKGFYIGWEIGKNPDFPIVLDAANEYFLHGTRVGETIKKCHDPVQFTTSRAVTGGALWSDETYPNTEEYEEYIKRVPFKQNKALEKRNVEYQKQFILAEADKWYIGKTVRFYYAKEGKPMYYKKSGNRVPKSEGCKPMMQLPRKLPKDIDIDKYITLAIKAIEITGATYDPK